MQTQMSITCSTAGSDRDQSLNAGEKWTWDGERQVFCNWMVVERGLRRVEAKKLVGEKGYLQSLPKPLHFATRTRSETKRRQSFANQVGVMLFSTAYLEDLLFIYLFLSYFAFLPQWRLWIWY